ncbi:biliverdin-producing heme oxygenase [Azohydromonas aeria]|uniref:biliverdin-producing heme oxygenase n=1 Tax=Azohydromonas aeria TaxID=2590212 RepID=UPI0012FB35F8|nr:biliverdin-producing heme oxygenase [Azohydromonas aeria]
MKDEALPQLGALRRACAGRHEAIEALLRLDEALEPARYARVLAGFAAFVPRWEALVRARLPARLHGWFDARSRLPLLRRDLAALHLAPAAVDDPVAALALPDLGAALGSMYVLEGSALGGQLIARQLRQRWDMGPDNGAGWFTGHGARTGALWADFRACLARELGQDAAALASACAAGAATFDALLRCFEQVLGAEGHTEATMTTKMSREV